MKRALAWLGMIQLPVWFMWMLVMVMGLKTILILLLIGSSVAAFIIALTWLADDDSTPTGRPLL